MPVSPDLAGAGASRRASVAPQPQQAATRRAGTSVEGLDIGGSWGACEAAECSGAAPSAASRAPALKPRPDATRWKGIPPGRGTYARGLSTEVRSHVHAARSLSRPLAAWTMLSSALAAGLLVGAAGFRGDSLPAQQQEVVRRLLLGSGLGLALATLLVFALRGRLEPLLAPADAPDERSLRRPRTTLFVASFVALLLELALIRYCGSQIRIFAFYKNVPLMGCFLGLGLGCFLGRGRPAHALAFLLWLVPVLAFLSQGTIVLEELLSQLTAAASSEHVLGDSVLVQQNSALELASQVLMGLFCAATLVTVTLLFRLLGRLLGESFERVPRLPAYTLNIVGSLAGIVAFVGLSFLQCPPWGWFLLGTAPLLWWTTGRSARCAAAGLAALG